MSNRRAIPSLKRRAAVRSQKARMIIVCEGKNTEPEYITSFAREYGNQMVEIVIIGGAGVPATLLERALVERKKAVSSGDFQRTDHLWIVFDRDEHPEIPATMDRARAVSVKCAYSNPCFEIWPILHFTDFDAPLHRHEVQELLKKFDGAYDPKSRKSISFADLSPRYPDACKRARSLRLRREEQGDPLGDPYTDVDLLLEEIVCNGRKRGENVN